MTREFQSQRLPTILGAVLCGLLAGGVRLAEAQTGSSVVQGSVVDAVNRKPVVEALVTVTSPSLQGELTALTDRSGYYRVPRLPPGVYRVRVDRDRYESYEQNRVTVRTDVTLQVNVFMVPGTVEGKTEAIEISQAPPTIDVGSSSVATTFSEEMIRRLPLIRPDQGSGVRSYEAVAASAPQAKNDTYGASISGTTSPENRYIIDGLPVNDASFGTGTTPLSSEFLKEVNVVTGGYLPEYGRATGGIISATVKSGSNDVRGSAWTNVAPGALEGTGKQVFEEGNTIYQGHAELRLIGDLGADIGLPLIKDRLWLYLGVLGATERQDRPRALYATEVDAAGMPIRDANDRTVRTLIPGTQRVLDDVSNSLQAIGKLSFSPSQHHSFALTSIVAPWRRHGARGGLAGSDDAIMSIDRGNQLSNTLKWTATAADNKITFENTVGWHHVAGAFLPRDGSLPGSREGLAGRSLVSFRRSDPGYHPITDFENVPNADRYCEAAGTVNAVRCPVTSYDTDSLGYIETRAQDRLQLRSVMTILARGLGHHVFKLGVDVERVSNDLHKAMTGGNAYEETSDGTGFADAYNYAYLTGPDQVVFADSVRAEVFQWGIGAFAQNSWSILDKVTLNLGIRYDSEYVYNNQGRLSMALPNQIAPRVGLIYDPTQAGRSRMFASFARYYQQVPLDIADRALSAEAAVYGIHDADICNPRDPAKLAACRDRSSYRPTGENHDPDQIFRTIGGTTTPVDPDLKSPTVDEYILGAEYQLLPESRLSLTFTRRRLKDMIEDMSVDEAQTYFIGNPGQGIGASFPVARRDYDAMTLVFVKEFLDNWLVQASYTLARLEGNIAGLFRPETGQLDPNQNSDFDLISLLPNRTGPLSSDNRHQIRLAGAYDISLSKKHHINVGSMLRATSGGPTNHLGSHRIYGSGEVFILPRGAGERLPWRYSANLSLRYGVALTEGHTLEASVSVYNLLNLQLVTGRDQDYTRTDVLPIRDSKSPQDLTRLTSEAGEPFDPMDRNPNFGQVTSYQAPRVFTLGLRYSY